MTAERHDASFAGDGFRAQDATAKSASARSDGTARRCEAVMHPCFARSRRLAYQSTRRLRYPANQGHLAASR